MKIHDSYQNAYKVHFWYKEKAPQHFNTCTGENIYIARSPQTIIDFLTKKYFKFELISWEKVHHGIIVLEKEN